MLEDVDSAVAADSGFANDRLNTTVSIVAAYVSHNSVRAADLAGLIEMVYGTLGGLSATPVEEKQDEPLVPAVSIKKSITPDFLICLEDGKKFRSLKRHLGTVYNMTPEQYRVKWGLPRDYPMVAPAYSAVRSQLAKDIGLGRPGKAVAKTAAEAPSVSAPATGTKKPRAKRT